nr:AIPR family protein [Bacillus velezensis]
MEFKNLNFFLHDLDDIQESIEIKKGLLPKDFREKTFRLNIEENFSTFETTVAKVRVKDFSQFVNEGENLLFHSNIRNYLKSTKINKGIKDTIRNEPENFWYYNNGVTVVCDEYYETMGSLVMKAPQIVNGCQTAKTLGDFYKHKTNKELSALESNGHLLVKVIKTKRSAEESQKKELRDNITRYTNSQNAVRGLDFYALDRFQNGLKDRMKNLGYFYEIQRGAFITLDRKEQESYRGNDSYNYLLGSVNRKKKYVLPAKEVIQSFTAAIKLMPNVAYGRANELTPVGSRWKDIMNEETKGLPLEHFLFPYLILMYAKEELKYKSGSNDFRVNSAFLFIATYYLLITEMVNKHADKEYDSADKINVEVFKDIFNNQNLNKQLLLITNRTLRSFFKDFSIEEAIGDNLRGFVQNKMKKGSTFWIILERKIYHNLDDLEFENIEVYEEIKEIISKNI